MIIIISLIFILTISPAHAKIYKCIDNGQTSYQQTQCKQPGTKFSLEDDISIEQQQAALKKLNADLEAIAEKKKLQKEEDDKERLLRAQEDNAKANKAQAEETAQQTDAIENSNKRQINQPYYLPYRPIIKPLPEHPIAKPMHSLPVTKP